jgi:hypothetical protein
MNLRGIDCAAHRLDKATEDLLVEQMHAFRRGGERLEAERIAARLLAPHLPMVAAVTNRRQRSAGFEETLGHAYITAMKSILRYRTDGGANLLTHVKLALDLGLRVKADKGLSKNSSKKFGLLGERDIDIVADEDRDNLPLERQQLHEALRVLDDRQRQIIERHLGLGDCEAQSFETIGRAFGLTGVRMRQIYSKGIERLRRHLVRKHRTDLERLELIPKECCNAL